MVGTLTVLATPTSAAAAPIFDTPTPTIVAATPEISSQVSQVRVAATRFRSFSRDDVSEIMIGRNPPNAPQSAGAIPGVWPKGTAIPFTMSYRNDTRVATVTVTPTATGTPVTFTNTVSGGPTSTLAGPDALVNVVRFDLAVQAATPTTRATIATIQLSDLSVNGSTFAETITLESTSASGAAPRLFSNHLLVGFTPSSSVEISGTMLLTGSFVASQEASRVEIVLGSDAPPVVTLSSPPAEIALNTDYPITASISDTLLDSNPALTYTVPTGCSLSDAQSSTDTVDGLTSYSETRQLRCTTPGARSMSVSGADAYNPARSASTDAFEVLPERPAVTSMQLASSPAAVNTPVTVTATTNPTAVECVIEWDDGTTDRVAPVAGVCSASHSFDAEGSFDVTVSARDERGRESERRQATVSIVADPLPTVSAGDAAGYAGEIDRAIAITGTATDEAVTGAVVEGVVVESADSRATDDARLTAAAGIASTAWTVENSDGSPAPCTIDDPTSLSTTVSCTEVGSFTLVLTAVDSASQERVERVPLEITLGDLPTLPLPEPPKVPELASTGAAHLGAMAVAGALLAALGGLVFGATRRGRRAELPSES